VKRTPTVAMTPRPDCGYDPIAAIMSGRKAHTLRRHGLHGEREVTVRRQRTGIVLRFVRWETMTRDQYLTDEFAQADGLPDARTLEKLLVDFYGEAPPTMICSHFEVVTTSAPGEPLDVVKRLGGRFYDERERVKPMSDQWFVNDQGRMARREHGEDGE